jgi:putative metallohydrolase (TIGR04338 family)
MSPISRSRDQVDRMRARVYAAEDQFAALMNRGGSVDFFGSQIDIPIQRRFGDIDSVRTYVESVIQLLRSTDPNLSLPRVRVRRGSTRAHYEFDTQTMAFPVNDQWALRETVILHECAHHVTLARHGSQVPSHGNEYVTSMLELVSRVLGEGPALLLRTGYQELEVPVTPVGQQS